MDYLATMLFFRHSGKVHYVAFSPNGTISASGGSANGTGEVYLWQAAPREVRSHHLLHK
jgi:hypothetical protein